MTVKITQILIKGNNISDFFANLAVDRESNEYFVSYVELPREVRELLKMDRQGFLHLRTIK